MSRLFFTIISVAAVSIAVPAAAQLGGAGSRGDLGASPGSSRGLGSGSLGDTRSGGGADVFSSPSVGSSLSREPAGAPRRVPTGEIGLGVGAGAGTLSGSSIAPGRSYEGLGGTRSVPSTLNGARGDCPPGSSPGNPTYLNCLPTSSAISPTPR
jgi:hypothetical protein